MTTNDACNFKTVAIATAIVGWPSALLVLTADVEASLAAIGHANLATMCGTMYHAAETVAALVLLFA